jgi:hypothetical protein
MYPFQPCISPFACQRPVFRACALVAVEISYHRHDVMYEYASDDNCDSKRDDVESYHGTTSSPILRALPTTDRATLSSPRTFSSASAILILAISYICLTETFPANPADAPAVFDILVDSDGAACEPFSMLAHCLSR